MSKPADWLRGAFFDTGEPEALDGGTTSQGPLWHAVSVRWGHSMHTMCSYHGMFPAKLAHYFIQRYSRPGDLVGDPFSGRGTTVLQARVEGRRSFGGDLNPLAYVLTRAKAQPPSWAQVTELVTCLEKAYRQAGRAEVDAPADIRMLFHKNTLRQLAFLRDRLLSKAMSAWTSEEFMLAGALAGILHGAHREDGTSAYLSISMPNTFSMSPAYVRKYIRENGLVRLNQDVFEKLRCKLARLYLDSIDGRSGRAFRRDARALLTSAAVKPGSVDLILTSPPYLRVMNYGTSNWIRLWWLGLDDVGRNGGAGRQSLDAELDHQHNYDSYRGFMLETLHGIRRVLAPHGAAVLVIGDVATPDGPSLALAQQLWEDVGAKTGLRLVEFIEDSLPIQSKVSRIWGETKGRATDRDCVLVLGRTDGLPRVITGTVDWEEPYKDAGPDAAHELARPERTRSRSGRSQC